MRRNFMTRFATITALCAAFGLSATAASDFDKNFCDSTLRIDCTMGGGPSGVHVLLNQQSKSAGWYGRRARLDRTPNRGNGNISVLDPATGEVLYTNPFSTLFHEWLSTPEAETTNRAFENSFVCPLPKGEADIRVALLDSAGNAFASLKFRYRPDDELVAVRENSPLPHRYLHHGGDPKECIDVAILAEGYTTEEMDSFVCHAQRSVDEMLSYEPYKSNKERFNFVAVMLPSTESGVSIPLKRQWRDTPLGAHFSTFYSARYLTVPRVFAMYDALDSIPFEHIMVLVNTDNYGGGGIYNCYHIAAARNNLTLPVSVHEFGHSFGGLADEYFYKGQESDTYPLDIEPWEANITTLVDFDSKWRDMVEKDTPIPTPWEQTEGTREEQHRQAVANASLGATPVGAYEGGGYRSKGIYRPTVTCRMRDNYYPKFCPVCERALQRVIDFYTLPE